MLRNKAKTKFTCRAFCCILGGFIAYMQFGAALFIHANIQPYVTYWFFLSEDEKRLVKSIEEVYIQTGSNFFYTYLVFALCMIGMVLGLQTGKQMLLNEMASSDRKNFKASIEPGNPRNVYLIGALSSTVAMFAASFVVKVNFWAYSALFGFVNGYSTGMAYQAPMHAVQLYFPDRKGLVSKVLLIGMAIGIGLYSYLTL